MDDGVPIAGYIFWTISDNWEWADGYCPKFGLYEVDRSTKALRRIPRPSAHLFTSIVKNRRLAQADRNQAWEGLKSQFGKPRPFCRSADGLNSLDKPEERPLVPMDWRFVKPNQ
jgi:hypothetical protein